MKIFLFYYKIRRKAQRFFCLHDYIIKYKSDKEFTNVFELKERYSCRYCGKNFTKC